MSRATARVFEETTYVAHLNGPAIIAIQRALSFARDMMGISSDDPIHEMTDLFTTLANRAAQPVTMSSAEKPIEPAPAKPKNATPPAPAVPPPPSTPPPPAVHPLNPDIFQDDREPASEDDDEKEDEDA